MPDSYLPDSGGDDPKDRVHRVGQVPKLVSVLFQGITCWTEVWVFVLQFLWSSTKKVQAVPSTMN